MHTNAPVSDRSGGALASYLSGHGFHYPLLISDPNTHDVAGGALNVALDEAEFETDDFVLDNSEPAADAESVGDILIGMAPGRDVVIGVGGGTVTDVARLVSHRMGLPFLSYPTAPSVDAYSSPTSAMTFRGVKKTVPATPAAAVFVDPEVLSEAPHAMIAAGFADMAAKLTSSPDWKLSGLLGVEEIDERLMSRARAAAESCVAEVDQIAALERGAMSTLMDGLIESGDCMREWSGSRPASGTEHLLSHFWEMRAYQSGAHSALHGERVALGTIVAAGLFQRLARIGTEELERRIGAAQPPGLAELRRKAAEVFGADAADRLLEGHVLASMTEERYQRIAGAAVEKAGELIELAGAVRPPEEFLELMRRVSGPTHPRDIGLEISDVRDALTAAHFIRNRFGLLVFWHLFDLGSPEETADAVFD